MLQERPANSRALHATGGAACEPNYGRAFPGRDQAEGPVPPVPLLLGLLLVLCRLTARAMASLRKFLNEEADMQRQVAFHQQKECHDPMAPARTTGAPTTAASSSAPTAAPTFTCATTSLPHKQLVRAWKSYETHAFPKHRMTPVPNPGPTDAMENDDDELLPGDAPLPKQSRPRSPHHEQEPAEVREMSLGKRWRPCTTSTATPRGRTSHVSSSLQTKKDPRSPGLGKKSLRRLHMCLDSDDQQLRRHRRPHQTRE